MCEGGFCIKYALAENVYSFNKDRKRVFFASLCYLMTGKFICFLNTGRTYQSVQTQGR